MTTTSDLDKKVTMGDADGPLKFIPELGMEVPTFVNPRDDLINDHARNRFIRLSHHVPFKMRGIFRPQDWPEKWYLQMGKVKTDTQGYVLCTARIRTGEVCSCRAVNRTLFCRSHSGALHPADKKLSGMTLAPMPIDRVDSLDRVQKFMQGIIQSSDLADDEIQGSFVRNNDGVPVSTAKLGVKFQQQIAKELHVRLNEFLRSKASSMLKVMAEIAENDLYEAADRVKAATWISERVLGKVPDVFVHSNSQDLPYTSILDSLEGGSREAYRQEVASERVEAGIIDAEIMDDGEETEEKEEEVSEEGEEVVLQHARTIEDDRREKLERAKALRKAKQRRYAARAVGAASLSQTPWLVEFIPYKYVKAEGNSHNTYQRVCREEEAAGYKLKLIPPDQQTPAVIDRIRGCSNPT